MVGMVQQLLTQCCCSPSTPGLSFAKLFCISWENTTISIILFSYHCDSSPCQSSHVAEIDKWHDSLIMRYSHKHYCNTKHLVMTILSKHRYYRFPTYLISVNTFINQMLFLFVQNHFFALLILCPKMHHYHMWHLLNTILIGYILWIKLHFHGLLIHEIFSAQNIKTTSLVITCTQTTGLKR